MTWAFLVDSVPFTRATIAGATSLGGSESACVVLARALADRGHRVHLFTTKIADDARGPDAAGVQWHHMDEFWPMNQFIEWDVAVALRWFGVFGQYPIYARLRVLWNQDLLIPGDVASGVMSVAWAFDQIAYVSDYHRRQWEQIQPELAPLGWATRNCMDHDLVPDPETITKHPHRIIHVSRPERGLGPLLEMWPAFKAAHPRAELHLCRYSSMYDQGPGSWSDVCATWDARVREVQAAVGGITYLGELSKPELYRAIAESAVMWYPGVANFAETSCIAAIEAQACGTPFVGSYRGALPETVHPEAGVLIKGDPSDPAYQAESLAAVGDLLRGCERSSVDYRARVRAGRDHARAYTAPDLARAWERQVQDWFAERYTAHRPRVLRTLLHEDDHTAARLLAQEMGDTATVEFCDYVIAGKDQGPEDYGEAAIHDPIKEGAHSGRLQAVAALFTDRARLLDVACGNGALAILAAQQHPGLQVFGFDYAAANIERARAAAERVGVADRCHFEQCVVWDFDRQDLTDEWRARMAAAGAFDAMFVGEFVEHVGGYQTLIDGLEAALAPGARVVYTCPHGPFGEMMGRGMPIRRGHVHHFHADDVQAVWGPKEGFGCDYLAMGTTERGNPIGHWLISYTRAETPTPAGARPFRDRILRTRPFQSVTLGMITKNAENDLGRALASAWKVADEILIGDTGSTDQTVAIAESYGATVLPLGPVEDIREGFAGARNAVLAKATGEWFFWMDADEILINAPWVRRYLDGQVFNGYVLHQTHLYLDGEPTFDIPVRIFRHTGRVQFYGCVHEQPQDGDANTDITPALDVMDIRLAHTGYLTQELRESKRTERNLPLLIRDAKVFPERMLGKVLQLREGILQADANRAEAGGAMTAYAFRGYQHVLQLFIALFDDPAHKMHGLARPWYEAALRALGIGWEQEFTIGGKFGGMGGARPRPERLWVRDAEELTRLAHYKTAELAKKMQPVRFITDPDLLATAAPTEDRALEGVPV